MPQLCTEALCTGCTACYAVCPKEAITMRRDERGFLHPAIDHARCVECKLCERRCPVLQENTRESQTLPQVYAAWHADRAVRVASSSGGAFSAIAESVIERGGVVYGAAWGGPREVRHVRVADSGDLSILRKSKYIPSDMGDTLCRVKTDLEEGREVLFSGSPCQIAGLYSYLAKTDISNLSTVDFICHGVPSPAVYWKYLDSLEERYHSVVTGVNFRDKKLGVECNLLLKVSFEDEKEREFMFGDNSFYRAFVENVCLRRSCHSCTFNTLPRVADISLADYRGLGEKSSFSRIGERYLGFTGLIVNTQKGARMVAASPNLGLEERPATELFNSQPHLAHPANPSSCTELFWKDFVAQSYNELADKYFRMSFSKRLVNLIRFILRPRLYYALGRIAKKFR